MNKIIIFLSGFLLLSCSGMNDNIEEYLDRGEINYIGRVDSAVVHGGNLRAQFMWKVGNDPRIEGCKIFWNDKKDSTYIPIDRNMIDDEGYYSTIVSDLVEGTYIFNMYHVGEKGYPSIKHEVVGNVYGEKYQNNLTIREIGDMSITGDNDVLIKWRMAKDSCSVQLNYQDITGSEKTIEVLYDNNSTLIKQPKLGSEFTYKTIYSPEYQALDKFYVNSGLLVFPVK